MKTCHLQVKSHVFYVGFNAEIIVSILSSLGYLVYILMIYKVDGEIIRNKLQVLNVTLEKRMDALSKELNRDKNSDILRDYCLKGMTGVSYFLN